jgi:FkbM family methyltransferase
MKHQIQALLKRVGLLERVQNSFWYDVYWKIFDRQMIDRRSHEQAFYRDLLTGFQRGDLVFDVGANCGDKTEMFLRLGARVLSVEPDDVNQGIITRRFLRYRFSPKPVTVVGKALSDRNTVTTMWINPQNSGLTTLSPRRAQMLTVDVAQSVQSVGLVERRVPTTTLEDLFAGHGVPFFVKIDVEGLELNVLRGMKRAVPFVQFEVNLPEFEAEGLQCIAALESLADNGRFNYAFDCQRGLELDRWMGAKEFAGVFKKCGATPIEVFWKTGPAAVAGA